MAIELIIFIILAVLAIISAIGTVAAKHPVVSALSLVFHFLMLGGIYLAMNAQFLAIMQVLVYGGAIMVLVVFTIMLLNLGDEAKLKINYDYRKVIAWMIGIAFAVQVSVIVTSSITAPELTDKSIELGTAQNIGMELFTNHIYPIEITGMLLFGAIVGAMVMAKRKIAE